MLIQLLLNSTNILLNLTSWLLLMYWINRDITSSPECNLLRQKLLMPPLVSEKQILRLSLEMSKTLSFWTKINYLKVALRFSSGFKRTITKLLCAVTLIANFQVIYICLDIRPHGSNKLGPRIRCHTCGY